MVVVLSLRKNQKVKDNGKKLINQNHACIQNLEVYEKIEK